MSSLFCIRDGGGVRRFKTYLSREQAEAAIDRENETSPGCRAPLTVAEFVEATPAVLNADELLRACKTVWNARGIEYPAAFMTVREAIFHATEDRP